jgi:hypothetical protein
MRSTRLAGQSLCERAILALKRGGVERIFVSNDCPMGVAAIRRLADRGISLLTRGAAANTTPDRRSLVVVSADVAFEPGAVHRLVGRLATQNVLALAAYEASPGTFVALTPDAAASIHAAGSDRDILDRLDPVRVTSLGRSSGLAGAVGRRSGDTEPHLHAPVDWVKRFGARLRSVLTPPLRRRGSAPHIHSV